MTRFCPKCQIETERKKNGSCKPCAKASSAVYRAANREKVNAQIYAWNAANREKVNARTAAWKLANPAKINAYVEANSEKLKAQSIAWRKANPESVRIFYQNRRAKKNANGGKLSKDLAKKLCKLQKGKCPCCYKPLGDNYHLDHIVPLALGGSNTDDNIQLLRSSCNHQKSAKHPIDFMQSKGFLL